MVASVSHMQTFLFQPYWNTFDQKANGEYFWEQCCRDLFGKKEWKYILNHENRYKTNNIPHEQKFQTYSAFIFT